MPLKSALLRDFGGCCFAVTLLKVAFMVIRGDLYNSYVIGIHNYYRYATHVRNDFYKIAFQISRKLYARTKSKLKRHGKPLCGYIKEIGRAHV